MCSLVCLVVSLLPSSSLLFVWLFCFLFVCLFVWLSLESQRLAIFNLEAGTVRVLWLENREMCLGDLDLFVWESGHFGCYCSC